MTVDKSKFISGIVASVGIRIVPCRGPANARLKGRYGFTRLVKDGLGEPMLERSAHHYGSIKAAEAAAHSHYRLRSA